MYIRRIKVSKSRVPLLFKSLLYKSSICTTCCGFLFQQNTTQVKRTSHAMQKYLSLQQHRCLLPAAPQAEVAGGGGLLSLRASPTVTCWFHRSETGCLPQVSGGCLT